MAAFFELFGGTGLAFLGAALAVGLCCIGSDCNKPISSYSLSFFRTVDSSREKFPLKCER